jgi:hypothetical protein
MDLLELETYNADLVAEIRHEAALAERQRQASLDAMEAPGCEAIIAKARKNPAITPESVALECLTAVQAAGESENRLNALRRDASSASKPPAGDAPRWKAILTNANANGRRMR